MLKNFVVACTLVLATAFAVANPAAAKVRNADIAACDQAALVSPANTVDGKQMTLSSAHRLPVHYALTIPGVGPIALDSGENPWSTCADPDTLAAFLAAKNKPAGPSLEQQIADLKAQVATLTTANDNQQKIIERQDRAINALRVNNIDLRNANETQAIAIDALKDANKNQQNDLGHSQVFNWVLGGLAAIMAVIVAVVLLLRKRDDDEEPVRNATDGRTPPATAPTPARP